MIFNHSPKPKNQHFKQCLETLAKLIVDAFCDNYESDHRLKNNRLHTFSLNKTLEIYVFNSTICLIIDARERYNNKSCTKFIRIAFTFTRARIDINIYTTTKKKYCLKEISKLIRNKNNIFSKFNYSINRRMYKKL